MGIDVTKQVGFWRKGAQEDWDVGADLVRRGRTRHGLFFVHLAVEKLLKAHVCKATNAFAPKIHLLPRLAELSGLTFSVEQLDFLAMLNRFCLAGRYPRQRELPPSRARALEFLRQAEEMKSWLTDRF
jgi:HEPN domain-containing protein